MNEKRKWFDSRGKRQAKIPIPQPFGLSSNVTDKQCENFLNALDRKQVSCKVFKLFMGLTAMSGSQRLGRNLKVLLSRMMERPIVNFMRDALLPHELDALIALASMGSEYQEVAQSLLNIDERYQLAGATRGMFEVERKREKVCGQQSDAVD